MTYLKLRYIYLNIIEQFYKYKYILTHLLLTIYK